MTRHVLLALLCVGCVGPNPLAPPKPPAGSGNTGSGDDTAADCGTCTLYDCEEDGFDVTSERECEDAASDWACADWEWDACR